MLRAEIKFQQGTQRDLQYCQRSPALLEAITYTATELLIYSAITHLYEFYKSVLF